MSRTIAKCCENCSRPIGVERPDRSAGPAALGDRLASPPGTPICPSPVKSKVTFGWLVVGSKFCSGFLISVPFSAGRSLSTYCRDFASCACGSESDGLAGAAATHRPLGHRLDHRALGLLLVVELDEEVLLPLRGSRQKLVRLLVEQVVGRPAASCSRRHSGFCFEANLHRGPEVRERVGLGRDGLARVRMGRIPRKSLLGRRDDVRLEVVEVELRGLPDELDRLLGVLDVRQTDLDAVLPDARDLRLGDAELVDPGSDDVDRPVDRARRRRWASAGWAAPRRPAAFRPSGRARAPSAWSRSRSPEAPGAPGPAR